MILHNIYYCVHSLLFFIFVETHVREDSRQLVDAVERHDLAQADCSAKLIHRRCQRMIQAINDDLGVQPSHYTQQQAEGLSAQLKDLSETGLATDVVSSEEWFILKSVRAG